MYFCRVVTGPALYSNWFAGAPGSITFPVTPTCGNYYQIKMAVQNSCIGWVQTVQDILINCTPTPVITGPTAYCLGTSDELCVNYTPSSQYSIHWAPGFFASATGQCFNTLIELPAGTPAPVTQVYSATVTSSTGCAATATYTITAYPNNPAFSLTLSPICPTNYCHATATVTDPTRDGNAPGFGDMWIISELNSSGAVINYYNATTPCWWTYPAAQTFPGFDGAAFAENCANTAAGTFVANTTLHDNTWHLEQCMFMGTGIMDIYLHTWMQNGANSAV